VRHRKIGPPMSALGHLRPVDTPAAVAPCPLRSESGQIARVSLRLLCANSDLAQCSKKHRYSITSSALASKVGGTSRPSVLAVLRLITSSYLVGACSQRTDTITPRASRSVLRNET